MKANIMDITDIVNTFNLKEVTNPVHFDKGQSPTSDGLFSYEHFGRAGSSEREKTFAYIDLHERFIHPAAYQALIRLNRKIDSCIAGTKYFKIVGGELVEDENGGTGIQFLFDNWEKLVFKKTESVQRNVRIDLLKSPKTLIFKNKEIVIPPFYRDINLQTQTHDVLNDMYAKLIRLSKSLILNQSAEIGNIGHVTRYNIQTTINEIYEYCTSKIKGSDGLMHQAVLGKSIDYGARLVISSAHFDSDRYDESLVSYKYAGVPLSQFCVLFFPYVVSKLEKWFKEHLELRRTLSYYDNKTKKAGMATIDQSNLTKFSYDNLVKQINRFIKTPAERFDLVTIPTLEKGEMALFFTGNRHNVKVSLDVDIEGDDLGFTRQMTWTDILFIICSDIAVDKHVYITRYPLIDYFGTFPARIHLLSTMTTEKLIIDEVKYDFYPVIDLNMNKKKVAINFYDTLQFFNAYLGGLGVNMAPHAL